MNIYEYHSTFQTALLYFNACYRSLFTGLVTKLFKIYLSGMFNRVKLSYKVSDSFPIDYGAPHEAFLWLLVIKFYKLNQESQFAYLRLWRTTILCWQLNDDLSRLFAKSIYLSLALNLIHYLFALDLGCLTLVELKLLEIVL